VVARWIETVKSLDDLEVISKCLRHKNYPETQLNDALIESWHRVTDACLYLLSLVVLELGSFIVTFPVR